MIYQTLRFFKRLIIKPIYNLLQYRLIDIRQYNLYKNSFENLKALTDVRLLKPASGELREFQLKLLEFAKEVLAICKYYNIKPFLFAGTLLGAERHSGFIPWDDDFDVALMRSDYEKLKNIAKEKYIYVRIPKNKIYITYHRIDFLNELFKKYPNKLIFIQLVDAIHLVKGTSFDDYVKVDFFSLDYYSDNYPYDEHVKYADKLLKKRLNIYNFTDEIKLLEQERISNPNITERSNTISFGLDNPGTYIPSQRTGWWTQDDFFPLKKIKFEDTEFYAPNNHIKILDYWCKNWREFPTDLSTKFKSNYK